jgi:poly-gamma-glutamate capsule biosynthesis protein CapA/YwtB (metallophosphatase superfamily)
MKMSRLCGLVLAAVCTAHASGQAPARPAASGDGGQTFSIALTGDSIITRRLAVYNEPQFVKMIDLIRGADVAFTNLEMLFHDYETYAMNESGGTYMRAEPSLVKELVWAGFDMVGRANNHTGDYGPEAMRLTTKYVEAAGLVQAGVGETLPEAREPHFLETAKARVGLVSCASTFTPHSAAGNSRGSIPGRPGLSPLRFTTTYATTADALAKLREALVAAGVGRGGGGRGGTQPPTSLTVFGTRLVVGDPPGVHTTPNQEDVDHIGAGVKSSARMADYTVVSIHAHEGGQGGRLIPAEFLVTFARAMIDSGADVFVAHGPHVLRGIEIYKGKPIFYSLGDFIFQNDTLLRLPSENYEQSNLGTDATVGDFNERRYGADDSRGFAADALVFESVVAIPTFRGKQLVELALHPISLGFKRPASQRGRPMLADAELGRKILDDVTRLSAPMGTTIQNRNGVGYVTLLK